jgi:hypothetical protein
VTVVEDLDGPEVAAGVDQDAVIGGLPGQAGAARSEGERHPAGRADPQQRGELVGVLRRDDRLRDQQIVRGVVGEREPVRGAGGDPARGGRFEGTGQTGVGGKQVVVPVRGQGAAGPPVNATHG